MITRKKSNSAGRRIQLNNSGVTLIELIVALLILAIIVIPLMGLFTSAAKTNAVNTQKADADIAAQNIMEAVKVYGLEETAKQINTFAAGGECLGMTPLRAPYTRDNTEGGSYAGGKFVKNNLTNKYSYELLGVKEGSHTYDVTIEFDSNYLVTKDNPDPSLTPIVEDVNKVDLYDLSALSEKTTVFVNPLSGAVYYDEDALASISELNESFMSAKYERDLADAQERNAAKQRAYDEKILAGVPSPTMEPFEELPNRSSYTVKYPDYIVANNLVSRKMIIEIRSENVAEGGTSKKVYKVNSVLTYTVKKDSELVEGDDVDDVSITRSGYCHDVTVDDIATVYVMYTPYPYMCQSAFDATYRSNLAFNQNTNHLQLDKYLTPDMLSEKVGANKVSFGYESVQINNLTDKDIDLYLIVQGDREMQYDDSIPLHVNVANTSSGSVNLFSRAPISGTLYTSDITKVTTGEHQDKLINIKVTVKDVDNDVERTVESTIQR